MRTVTRIVLTLLVVATVLVPVAGSAAPTSRLSGIDRYATAAAISAVAYPDGPVDVVYVATGENFPDALAAGPATGLEGPVLLVRHNVIPGPTVRELRRLTPRVIVVVGGAAAVDDEVLAALDDLATDGAFGIGGADRYETAALVSESRWLDTTTIAFLATGEDFPDALGASAAASALVAPILLTRRDTLPPATSAELTRLKLDRVYVVGGPSVISPAVVGEVAALGVEVIRLAGESRYGTNAAVTRQFSVGVLEVLIATGRSFPDALAGGALAGIINDPMLLVEPDAIPIEVGCELARLRPEVITILGGDRAVSPAVAAALEAGDYVADPSECPDAPPGIPTVVTISATGLYGDVLEHDGRLYLANAGDDVIEIIDVRTGIVLGAIDVGTDPWDLDVGPDGLLYVTDRSTSVLTVIDPGDRGIARTIDLGLGVERVAHIAIAADGRAVVSTTFDAEGSGPAHLYVVDLATGATTELAEVTRDTTVARSGDGSLIVAGETVPTVARLLTWDPATDTLSDLDTGSGIASIAVDDDGDTILVDGDTVYDASLTVVTVVPREAAAYGAAVAADGATAYRQTGASVDRLDVVAGTAEPLLEWPAEYVPRGLGELALVRDGEVLFIMADDFLVYLPLTFAFP